jgi:hypothetical protein
MGWRGVACDARVRTIGVKKPWRGVACNARGGNIERFLRAWQNGVRYRRLNPIMPEELMNLALMRPVSRVVNEPMPHGAHPYGAPFLIVYFPIPNLAVLETSCQICFPTAVFQRRVT